MPHERRQHHHHRLDDFNSPRLTGRVPRLHDRVHGTGQQPRRLVASLQPTRTREWNGSTFTDWIFPFFLFICGVSMTFSLGRRAAAGEQDKTAHSIIQARRADFPHRFPAELHPVFQSFHRAHSGRAATYRPLHRVCGTAGRVLQLAATVRVDPWSFFDLQRGDVASACSRCARTGFRRGTRAGAGFRRVPGSPAAGRAPLGAVGKPGIRKASCGPCRRSAGNCLACWQGGGWRRDAHWRTRPCG